MYLAAWLCAALWGAARAQTDAVTVLRIQASLEEEVALQVDHTVEYIVHFIPTTASGTGVSGSAVRLHAATRGGSTATPLLLTSRHRTGSITWQLPYFAGDTLLYNIERTLCPSDALIVHNSTDTDCGVEENTWREGEFTLHVGSSCRVPLPVSLRAYAVPEWRLALAAPTVVLVTQAAPSVNHYRFPEEQDSVRLVLESEDNVCALVAVHDYTCPIPQSFEDIDGRTLRLTMLRSGGLQLSKAKYPRGFYVIVAIGDSDAMCREEEEEAGDDPQWLWDALWRDEARPAPRHVAARSKRVALRVRRSLSRAQYAVAAAGTLAAVLAFYVAFGALVLAQRAPRWRRLVGPRAVLAAPPPSHADLAAAAAARDQRRRRRDSDATFDSSDNSDTDESDAEPTPATSSTRPSVAAISVPSPPRETTDIPPEPDFPPPAVVRSNGVEAPAPAAQQVGAAAPQQGAADTPFGLPARAQGAADTPFGLPARAQGAADTPFGLPARAQGAADTPFGLPARLHVAALARRRSRVLRARSDRYLYTLYTVAIFYTLPVMQFVVSFQNILNESGSLDMCYYNYLCAHPIGALSDFNHVFSNVGYLLLGALFVLQVLRRRRRRDRKPRDEEYGIPAHYGLLMSLGAGMMVVAVLSAAYHVCPNRLNFQFDTAFMYVLAVLSMVKIYQSRHPDINARAHATFAVLAVFIALVVWGVLGGGPLFWSIFTVLHIFIFLVLSLSIYYVGQFRLEKESLAETARALRAPGTRPLYTPRLVALLVGNAVNWGFALYGLIAQTSDIASHLLYVLLANTLLYMVFYLSMKLLHGERPRWYAWLYLAGALAAWLPALYYFMVGSTSWSRTPAESRHLNHECRLLEFYDSHDFWHILSAVALYMTFNAMLTWDDGLAAVKRTDIAVF